MKKFFAAAALLALVGCSGSTTSTIQALVASPIGQSLVTALVQTAAPQIDQAVASTSASVASSGTAKIVAYWLPWAQQALALFGPQLMSAQQVSALNAAASDALAVLQSPPADVNSAVADALKAYQDIASAISPALKPAS